LNNNHGKRYCLRQEQPPTDLVTAAGRVENKNAYTNKNVKYYGINTHLFVPEKEGENESTCEDEQEF
jgi:hypothetical protein